MALEVSAPEVYELSRARIVALLEEDRVKLEDARQFFLKKSVDQQNRLLKPILDKDELSGVFRSFNLLDELIGDLDKRLQFLAAIVDLLTGRRTRPLVWIVHCCDKPRSVIDVQYANERSGVVRFEDDHVQRHWDLVKSRLGAYLMEADSIVETAACCSKQDRRPKVVIIGPMNKRIPVCKL
jgi:hypothetical protein